ncbi:Lanthionine synthetase C family protein [Stanieria cyanosphaera PCC 7437]|uniref:Lanthionine synthetase C family protein n=1 Tax=Stanieria cyanosphaera (strain ATCC 29371 / PCC 7437) TaxID=111780 RepID=K9XSY9_STAC7|nr:type 2 lanthipeptide synthetase LanM family protein [Stanieria cyanosphaera]AFZ34787.1 Lanthionine synthetase C family protein [Stanieria cyanosphaera PCC 7437]
MNQLNFQTSAWYHAMTLSERVTSVKTNRKHKSNLEINSELAQRRMQRWRSQAPFNQDDSLFFQRLELDGISEEEFFFLLGEPIESVQKGCPDPPDWLNHIAKIFSTLTDDDLKPLPPSEQIKGKEISLFLYALEPLIDEGRKKLERVVEKISQTHDELPFEPNTVVEVLYANLPGKLLSICSRTLVLELQIAGLQKLLVGNTPEERFYSFIKQLCQPKKLLTLLEEYPILARQLVTSIEQWVRFSQEFLEHLSTDWEQIKATFSPEQEPGQLIEVRAEEGDSHREGRSVAIAKFSSGFQLVYKPRSLGIDEHFQQLLTWLNQRGNHPPFRIFKVLNRHSYGWVEFIMPDSCTSATEIDRFYQRQGGYLALLYVLEANDFHNENLIAAGEHPVLVDLESLFRPRTSNIDLKQSHLLANEVLYNDSVLRIGLLPQRIWSNGENDGLDISGLGGQEGQLLPNEVPYWEEIGTDQMRLKRKRMELPEAHNRPKLNGKEVDLLDYAEAIVDGFTKIYNLLLQHRDELLATEGILAKFAEDEARFLLRPTRLYAMLLKDGNHPKMLRNALERERLFDRLWFGVEHQSHLVKVISAERQDLWNGDVPMFTIHPSSRDLFTSSGDRIVDFCTESGMELVQRRLQNLNENDLKQQIHFIKSSLASLAMSSEQAKLPHYPLSEPQSIANREQVLKAAVAIADRLEQLALHGQDDAIWIGLTATGDRYWSLVPLGLDFYNGLPGITLFLAYLGALTQEQRYTSLAQAALNTIRSQLEPHKSLLKSIGAYDGWGGIIYTLTQLGILWDKPDLLSEAEELVKLLPPLIEQDRGLDLIAGAAGCLLSLLALYRCTASESTLTNAIACGDHLLFKAEKMPQGIGWTIPASESKPLTGLAHGAAGIALALLELWAVTGQKRFKTAAVEAIAYERSLFLPEMGNWPDLRDFSKTVLSRNQNRGSCMIAWCHGAVGIGLARLHSLTYLDDAEIRSEINTALETTLKGGFGSNHSLCHGDLGNLELLLQASLVLDEPQWQTQVERFASVVLNSIDQYGWLCGVPLGVETPGLMTGLAGIGYQLLRLAEPKLIPSVLLFEPPKNIVVSLSARHCVSALSTRAKLNIK